MIISTLFSSKSYSIFLWNPNVRHTTSWRRITEKWHTTLFFVAPVCCWIYFLEAIFESSYISMKPTICDRITNNAFCVRFTMRFVCGNAKDIQLIWWCLRSLLPRVSAIELLVSAGRLSVLSKGARNSNILSLLSNARHELFVFRFAATTRELVASYLVIDVVEHTLKHPRCFGTW